MGRSQDSERSRSERDRSSGPQLIGLRCQIRNLSKQEMGFMSGERGRTGMSVGISFLRWGYAPSGLWAQSHPRATARAAMSHQTLDTVGRDWWQVIALGEG